MIIDFGSDLRNLDDGSCLRTLMEEAGVAETEPFLGISILQNIIVNATAEVIDETTHRRLCQALINHHMLR